MAKRCLFPATVYIDGHGYHSEPERHAQRVASGNHFATPTKVYNAHIKTTPTLNEDDIAHNTR